MKIRLYSWFLSGNIGDILIAEEVSKIFSNYFDCVFFDISSFNQVDGPSLLKYAGRTNSLKARLLSIAPIRELIDCFLSFKKNHSTTMNSDYDAAIFAGGNSLMELNRYGAYYSKRLYNHVLSLKSRGVKVCFIYAGVGPIRNGIGRKYVKKILDLADLITVRDDQSVYACKSLSFRDVLVWRDPVLLKKVDNSIAEKERILVNIFFGEKWLRRSKMKKSYLALIHFLQRKYPDCEIVLFVTEASDTVYLNEIKKVVKDDSLISFRDLMSASELCDLYSRSKYVVGVRMHSIILSIIYNKPFLAIGWQPKVESLLDYFNCKERYISQQDFCINHERFFKIIESSFRTPPNLSNVLKGLAIENESNMAFLFDVLKNGDKNGLSV